MSLASSFGSARTIVFLVTLGALSLLASLTASATGTLVAPLPGDFSVDNKGSANYSIPLVTPPGRQGMQPKLSLNYSSGGGNGPLGVGFALSTGFPQSITRGRTILARDGVTRGVNFDDANADLSLRDKFYLDGKRLICVSTDKSYGQPGSVYRTEVDSFVTITTNATGSTINTFVVTDKSGTKMTFGKLDGATDGFQVGMFVNGTTVTADTLAYTWALKRVEDTLGNFCEFLYEPTRAATGEYVLSSIRYAGRSGVAAPTEIACTYGTRTDETISYVAGRRFKQSGRLNRIEVSSTNAAGTPTTLARYDFGFETGSDFGRNRLLSVSPSFGTGGALLAAQGSSFTWSNGTAQLAPCALTLPAQNDETPDLYGNSHFAQGDFDGDGRVDQVSSANGSLRISLANGSGFTEVQWLSSSNLSNAAHPMDIGPGSILALDINGDGRTDLLITDATSKNIYAVLSTGSGFTGLNGEATPTWISGTDTLLKDPGSQTYFVFRNRDQGAASSRIVTGDFTGDGRDDFLVHGYDGFLYLFKSTGAGFANCEASPTVLATPCSVDPVFLWGANLIGGDIRRNYSVSPMPMDINGDGIVDYIWIERANMSGSNGGTSGYSKSLRGVVSLPGGGFKQFGIRDQYAVSGGGTMTRDDAMFAVFPGDFNGDGLRDLLICTNGKASGSNGSRWLLWLNKGPNADGTPQWSEVWGAIPNSVTVSGLSIPTIYSSMTAAGWTNIGLNSPITSDSQYLGAFMAVTSTAGTGMVAADLNGDGLTDLAWYAYECAISARGWYVIYSDGKGGFSNPTKLPSAGALWGTLAPVPADAGSRGVFNDYNLSEMGDVDGDGLSEFAVKYTCVGRCSTGVTSIARNTGTFGDLVLSVTDGLGRKITTAYKAAKDDSIYTPGAAVAYPIREMRASAPVVAEVWKDSGSALDADRAQFSYQYSGNRLDLSGRGSLGFHSFVTLDRQTKLFTYQFLTQSFPMTGLIAREQTYRYWETGAGTGADPTKVNFRFINSHDNTVVFDEVSNGAGGGWGTVYPFISQAVESRWENGTVAHFGPWAKAGSPESKPEQLFAAARPTDLPHITITAKSWFDNQNLDGEPQTTIPGYYASDTNGTDNVVHGTPKWDDFDRPFTPANNPSLRKITYGNLRKLSTSYGDGFSETVVTDYKTAASITVNGVAVTTLSGLPETVTPTVTATGYTSDADTKAPIKRYTYWKTTPLVASETIDADRDGAVTGTLDLKTTYVRDDADARGRVKETQITGYVDSTTPDTSTTLTVSKVTQFNSRFDLPEIVENAYGHPTTTAYNDFLGLPRSVTDVNNVIIETDYDALGRATQTRDRNLELQSDTSFALTSATASDWTKSQPVAVPSAVTDGLALSSAYAVRTTTITSSTATAVVGTSMQPPVTAYFDRLGRTIRTVREGFAGQKTTTDTIYNKLGQIVATSLPYAVGATPLWTRTTYDKLGRVETVTAPNLTVTTNVYTGRVTQVSVDAPLLGGINPPAQVNTTLVDAKGRTIKVWNADNVPTSLDPKTGSTKAASVEYKLDGFGRMRSTVLLGNSAGTLFTTVTAKYDALGRQTELNDPDKGLWKYTNNVLGQVLTQEDARHSVTSSTFDPLGRPLTRTTTEPSSGPVETASWYYYDTAVNTTRHTVTKGEQGWIGALQREEASTPAAPGYPSSSFEAGKTATFHYFDAKGRPSITLTTIDKKWFYTCTDYDAAGRVGSVRNFWKPSGFEAPTNQPYMWQDFGYSYKYDSNSYLLELRDSSGQVWWEADATGGYDHLDRPALVRKGHGHWTKRTYRPEDGVLTAIQTGPTPGSATVQNLGFTFDGLGNLVSRTDTLNGLSETFGYDNLNRLTKRNEATVVAYLTNGNVSSKPDVNGGSSGTYAYTSSHPHAVTSAFDYAMTYDDNGNLATRIRSTTGETWATCWAGFDKPRWLAKAGGGTTAGSEFVYNANRSRVIQAEFDSVTVNGTSVTPNHYNRKRIYAWGASGEIDYKNLNVTGGAATANWQLDTVRLYVPGPDGVIGAMEFAPNCPPEQITKSKRALVYHYDHLGSVDTVTLLGDRTTHVALDDTGKQARHSFDPWGQRRDPTDWDKQPVNTTIGGHADVTPRGFTGHEMLDGQGLINMGGRIYDPLLNRFLSADILVQNPGDLQSFNRYSYVRNNPLTLTDPTGYWDTNSSFAQQTCDSNSLRSNRLATATPRTNSENSSAVSPHQPVQADATPAGKPQAPKPAPSVNNPSGDLVKVRLPDGREFLMPAKQAADFAAKVKVELAKGFRGPDSSILGAVWEDLKYGASRDFGVVDHYLLQPLNYATECLFNGIGAIGDEVLPGSGEGFKNAAFAASFLIGVGEERAALGLARSSARGLKMPTYNWRLAGTNTLGETATNGAVTLRPGMSWAEQARVLKHEGVHAFLSAKDGAFMAGLRQDFGIWGYQNSQVLRFTEEALAEGIASGSLLQGLAHPIVNPYGITVGGLLFESTLFSGAIGGSGYLLNQTQK